MVVVRREEREGIKENERREDGDDKPADDVCSVTARYLPHCECMYRNYGHFGFIDYSFWMFISASRIQHSVMNKSVYHHTNPDCVRHFSSPVVDLQPYREDHRITRGVRILGPAGACKWACAYICRCQ